MGRKRVRTGPSISRRALLRGAAVGGGAFALGACGFRNGNELGAGAGPSNDASAFQQADGGWDDAVDGGAYDVGVGDTAMPDAESFDGM